MKPRTEAQKLASRLNGARSKGPVTPEGKTKVAFNAVTHGLHAVNPVLQTENPEDWKLFLNDHIQNWDPVTLTEWDLVVNEVAGNKWRLRRLRATENALMDLETERVQDAVRQACARPDSALLNAAAWESLQATGNAALDRLHRHEARLRRIIAQAESQLGALIAARRQQEPPLAIAAETEATLPSAGPESNAPETNPGQQPVPFLVTRQPNPGPGESRSTNKPELGRGNDSERNPSATKDKEAA